MIPPPRPPIVLCADDDEDDRLLLAQAFAAASPGTELRFVTDGEALLDYLRRGGAWAAPGAAPRPRLVLLDLNLPRLDGKAALAAIRAEPALRALPVVVLTTSRDPDDVRASYDLGASSYVPKPASFERLVELAGRLARYWLEIVELPRSL